jgi:hypothetical protein
LFHDDQRNSDKFFCVPINKNGNAKMDRYDQELLDKQMARLTPPRNEGVIAVMLVVTFLVGMALGGVFSAHKSELRQIAAAQTNPDMISDAAPRPALAHLEHDERNSI